MTNGYGDPAAAVVRVPAPLGDYLAAGRTFLAWIRTGMALMGLGFVVARFDLFLRALAGQFSLPPLRSSGPPFWFGIIFIFLVPRGLPYWWRPHWPRRI